MKHCTKCGVEKSLDQFHYDCSKRDGLRTWCKTCAAIIVRAYRLRLKTAGINRHDRELSSTLQRKYKISEREYNYTCQVQGNKCAICGTPQIEQNQRMAVDHIHGTNVIRGLLCIKCNMALGLFKESSIVLRKAAEYVETWEQVQNVEVQSSILSFPRTAC